MKAWQSEADFCVIGSCLFLLAILIFIRLAGLKAEPASADHAPPDERRTPRREFPGWGRRRCPGRNLFARCSAFAIVLLAVLALPSSALRTRQSAPDSTSSAASLARFPKRIRQLRAHPHLVRAVRRTNARRRQRTLFRSPGSDEIILAIWVAPCVYYHDANSCWLARGLKYRTGHFPSIRYRAPTSSLDLNTGYYNDGVRRQHRRHSVACTPGSCSQSQQVASKGHFSFFVLKPQVSELAGGAAHPGSHHDSHRPSPI